MKKFISAVAFLAVGLCLLFFTPYTAEAQFGKKKGKKKSKKEQMYECGYVHKEGLLGRMNPVKALKKGLVGSMSEGGNSDLGTAAISVFYQAHLHPQGIMRYPTKTPGWQTCGDAVFAGFTNRSGIGISSTDGSFTVDGEAVSHAGMGTYFHGFSPDMRSAKQVVIKSSNGDEVVVEVGPAAPLEILSIDGKAKGEPLTVDGSKDIVIELKNGAADPNSKLHVQLICKLVGTPVIYDVIVTRAKNTIYIPKEAFKNFEGSPSPFAKENTLIVNRVVEKVIPDTDAGAIRTISAYMDWRPITMAGDIAKGSIMTAGFDESKNTNIDIELSTSGEYQFDLRKDGPFTSPPVKLMKKAAIASLVIRGNLDDTQNQRLMVKHEGEYKNAINEANKWFPELSATTWQRLADKVYDELTARLSTELNLDMVPIEQIVQSESYKYAKPVKHSVSRTFLEMGAKGSKRILTSSSVDLFQDLGITFGADFVSQRLVNEFDLDVVFAITIDLNFDFDSEGLDPKVSLVAFAPDVSYKTRAKYFSMTARTKAKSLDDSRQYTGGEENVIYQMIKADEFNKGLIKAIKELSSEEDKYPVYEALWKAKL